MVGQPRTYMDTAKTIDRRWVLVDAKDKILGRIATRIATILLGKHKPTYTPHLDGGDFVVVVNVDKIRLSGNKATKKVYQEYSGWSHGRREIPFAKLLARDPGRVLRLAVRRMMPPNRLRRKRLRKLKVYAGSEHPHTAQQPQKLEF